MDYLDRFFEPPRIGPVVSAQAPAERPRLMPQPAPAPPSQAPSYAPPADVPPTSAPDTDPDSIWVSHPGDVVAMEPRPNPPAAPVAPARSRVGAPDGNPGAARDEGDESRTHQIVRQNQWLTRFWMELTPQQQGRVERQLRRGAVQLAAERSDAAGAWDAMGLSDRVRLLFGTGQMPERRLPTDDRGAAWVRND